MRRKLLAKTCQLFTTGGKNFRSSPLISSSLNKNQVSVVSQNDIDVKLWNTLNAPIPPFALRLSSTNAADRQANEVGNGHCPLGLAPCWNCGKRASGDCPAPFFCGKCNALQPPAPITNYFKLMSMPEEVYDIDEEALEQRFKALQWQLHPDRYTTANAIEQSYSTDQAALVNEAYKVLKDPLLRAEYMLSRIYGLEASEREGEQDYALLEEMMELMDDVQSAEERSEVEKLRSDVESRLSDYYIRLAKFFSTGKLEEARRTVASLKYLDRIKRAIYDKI